MTGKTTRLFLTLFLPILLTVLLSCRDEKPAVKEVSTYQDKPFLQEFHDAYTLPGGNAYNDVRSIAADQQSNIWIATGAGIYQKKRDERGWQEVITGDDKGPAFAVEPDQKNTVWLGNWNGLFAFRNGQLAKVTGPKGPISAVCAATEGVYALGPNGFWFNDGKGFQPINDPIARSVRDVVSDKNGGLWMATDVGLYHWTKKKLSHFYKTDELISGYAKGLAFDSDQKLWVAGLGGITIRD